MIGLPTDDEARAAATVALADFPSDPSLDLAGATVQDPILVRTLGGEPRYVVVPLRLADGYSGFVRVVSGGTVAAVGRYGGASPLTMDVADVAARASQHLRSDEQVASHPTLVHDGPRAAKRGW